MSKPVWKPDYRVEDPQWLDATREVLERIGEHAPERDVHKLASVVRAFVSVPPDVYHIAELARLAPLDGEPVGPGKAPRPSNVELVGKAPEQHCVAVAVIAHELGHAAMTEAEFARRMQPLQRAGVDLSELWDLPCMVEELMANMHACHWGFEEDLRVASKHPVLRGPAGMLPGVTEQKTTRTGLTVTLTLTAEFTFQVRCLPSEADQ